MLVRSAALTAKTEGNLLANKTCGSNYEIHRSLLCGKAHGRTRLLQIRHFAECQD